MSDSDPSGATDSALEELFYPADRVPFVEWREFVGGRPTVALTAAVAVLAFVTGLSNLSRGGVATDGPLSAVVAVPSGVAGLGSVVLAFAIGVVAVGLDRRKHVAWRVAVVALPVLSVVPLSTFQATDVPLLLGIGVTVPLLVRNRDRFDQRLDVSPLQIASLSAIGGVLLYGTVGAYGLREQFPGVENWSDAVYFVVVTVATVGYGDITPATAEAKWFSLSIVLFGTGAFTVAVGSVIGPLIESRMAHAFGIMSASELTLLEDHVVVLGDGEVTEPLLDELDDVPVVVVTADPDATAALRADGREILTEDPTDESVLREARVDAARGVVVGSDDDARDALAVIATREIDADVPIVAAATESKHVDKLESVGADDVIDPRAIGGRLLGRSVMERGDPDARGAGAADIAQTIADDADLGGVVDAESASDDADEERGSG